jgi:hypothetical protein
MPAELIGVEIEARPTTRRAGHPTHVEVLRRPTPAGQVCSAVFGQLAEGDYELYRRPAGEVELQVTVAGGRVTEAHWP